MSNSTARKKATTKKSAKPATRKKRTLLIPDLADASVVAIDRAKAEFGVGHTTRAAARMIEDYWLVRGALREARETIREMEYAKSRYVRAYQDMQRNRAILEEELG